MPWGLAEESGKSARWLAAHSLPCAEPLLSLLRLHDGAELAHISPVSIRSRIWQALETSLTLCPIILGCALNDSHVLARRDALRIERVASPILLLPFLARVASLARCDFALSWRGAAFAILPESFCIDEDSAVAAAEARSVVIARTQREGAGRIEPREGGGGVLLEDEVWRALQAFAARIYVPASEESRLRGAGGIGEGGGEGEGEGGGRGRGGGGIIGNN